MKKIKIYLYFILVTTGLLVTKSSFAQTGGTPVNSAVISSYQGVSYQALNSVTLTPNFTFTASTSDPIFFIVISGQDQRPDIANLPSTNNVRTDIIKVPGIIAESQINNANTQSQISYMDGFGRPVERIAMHASPLQKDIVQFMVYDKYGREAQQYLPYVAATSDGSFQQSPVNAQQAFYQTTGNQVATDSYPFAVNTFDNSPLERVLEKGAPGADWQPGNHTLKNQFRLNATADNIRIWTTSGPTSNYYAETQLSVNDVTDENGNHTLSFTNKLGQLIEKKVQGDAGTWLETVYLYDDVGNLAYQVSPEGVKRIYGASPPAFDVNYINTWVSQYTYDAKNRLVAKQSPGAAPAYMVYDKYGRVVLVQDGRLRNAYGAADKWYFTKYDAANRPILSGLYTYTTPPNATGTTNQQKLQNYLDGLVYDNVTVFAAEKRASGTTYGYSNQSFPATVADADVLTVSYYDDYDFNNSGTPPNQYVNPNQAGFATAASDASGLLTGTMKRVINVSGNNGGWIKQAIFYDKFGNAIQKQTNNLINQSALDITSNSYDIYAGRITQTLQTKTQGTAINVLNALSYDLQDRLTQVSLQINGATAKTIATYEYNELGQLKDKKLGQTAAGYLQTVDYRYNIRGWLTGINNSSLKDDNGATTNDIWGMNILYNQADAAGIGNTPKYNGKISAIKWKANDQFSASTNPIRERGYAYTYDAIGRLLTAHYAANSGTAWNVEAGGYDESIGSYDQNGNIQSLVRNALANGATTPTQIDNLSYIYQNSNTSNQLASVSDISGNAMGFNNGASTATEYTYDTNGNLITDANKNQTITYNDLNKVSKIAITGGGRIEYMYDASGTRIRKTVFNSSGTVINQLDYMDGFVYNTNALAYFATAEGKVNVSGTNYTYEYFLKDHLGNTRISFIDNGSGTAKIVQENEYYAFGMTMRGMVERTAQPFGANRLLFNGGNELQDDLGYENSYSTAIRDYDPVLGRFNAIDPAVDKYADWTPYNFAFNDPVGVNDPNGDDPAPPDAPSYFYIPCYTCHLWGSNTINIPNFNPTPIPLSAGEIRWNYNLSPDTQVGHDNNGSYYWQEGGGYNNGEVIISARKVYTDRNTNQGGDEDFHINLFSRIATPLSGAFGTVESAIYSKIGNTVRWIGKNGKSYSSEEASLSNFLFNRSANLAEQAAKPAKIAGRALAGLSEAVSIIDAAQHGFSNRSLAKLGVATAINAIGVFGGPIGVAVSLGLGLLDNYGAFDVLYDKFSDKSRL